MIKIGQALAMIVIAIFGWMKKQTIRREVEKEIDEKATTALDNFDATDGSRVRDDDPGLFR